MTTPDPTGPHEDSLTVSTSGTGRKVAVAITGSVVTVAGIVMLVTPGPGILAILGGLGILGSEFPAARRVSNRLRRR